MRRDASGPRLVFFRRQAGKGWEWAPATEGIIIECELHLCKCKQRRKALVQVASANDFAHSWPTAPLDSRLQVSGFTEASSSPEEARVGGKVKVIMCMQRWTTLERRLEGY